jgi:hypothetical protein
VCGVHRVIYELSEVRKIHDEARRRRRAVAAAKRAQAPFSNDSVGDLLDAGELC